MNISKGITGIILSGGKSSRMGREKGLSVLKNKPLIEYSVQVLKQVCDKIIISTNTGHYNYLRFPVIKDEITSIGPIGGLYSCLKASETEDNFVLSCDMPLISVELINYIIQNKKNYQAVIPIFGKYAEPLCAYYRKDAESILNNFIERKDYKIQNVIKKLKYKFLKIDNSLEFYHQKLFANVNTHDDLVEIEEFLNTQK